MISLQDLLGPSIKRHRMGGLDTALHAILVLIGALSDSAGFTRVLIGFGDGSHGDSGSPGLGNKNIYTSYTNTAV